jgi:hypothetical protein
LKYLVLLFLAACSAPSVNQAPPKCLNVQEGDRHVEFDGKNLRLAEVGTPRSLALESGDEVACERLEILRNQPEAVMIQYSINGHRKRGVARISDATWIQKPALTP